ncbi:Uu.00g038970.m01.CDS01 [Anthostomella pinea]|uniref:Uu.00g038970.m01.CDS01 n=1 Tax=Anthostomella pinea TaxID=933095 RepID=A0AAI8YBD7_9PEZI|nr:Uu.00g038970.m01.CDS01 [Anthostomella pinea]
MSEPVQLWLDCDPGHDDVFAILLGAYHPGIKLLGISTVHGNASLDKTTNNALSVLKAIGKHDDIAVYPGAAQALQRDPIHAPTDIHGESGLDGTSLLPKPARKAQTDKSAVDAMADALRATAPGSAWVVATGGLTNVGALFQAHPELRAHIAGLSIMGGAVGGGFTPAVMSRVDDHEAEEGQDEKQEARVGNYTRWAEFNVLIDPEAAALLLEDPVLAPKTTLVPLDLTHLMLATRDMQDMLLYGRGGEGSTVSEVAREDREEGREPKSRLRVMLIELLNFFAETYRDVFGIMEGPPLHDPLAVAAILTGTSHEIPFYDFDPKSAEGPERRGRERFAVKVVTEGSLDDALHRGAQTGRTLVQLLPPGSEGVRIPRGLDIERFWRVVEECCQRADEANARLGGELR